jgi:parvulin-like peptidyl-prolyl isomerase
VLALVAGRPAAGRAEDGDAIALVNGRPISRARMVDVLMEGYGLRVMQQLIALELAKAETARLKLSVTPADVEAEFRGAVDQIAPATDAQGQKLGAEEKRQSLDFLLQQKNLTLVEFRLAMERNAHLRKIAERDFRVDEPTLREEFARLHGEKVEVRHIQVDDIPGLHAALDLLGKGTDFAEVARRVSKNTDSAPRGGLLEPFAFNDAGIAALLREQAFALKPGEVSKPLRVGQWWHILKLERRIAPENVRFEDVRGEVEKALRERVLPERMRALVNDLVRQAEVRVLDGALKQKYEELLKQNAAGGQPAQP